MTKLSDTQAILLSTAAQRESGSFLPLPSALKPGGGTTKALDALLKRGLAEEREISDPGAVRRLDGDLQVGLLITAAGLVAIGIEMEDGAGDNDTASSGAAQPPAPPKTSKTALVLDLRRRPDGATLPELIEVTGWLPHTTRAALTGLRKKGHTIERSKRGDATCYRIVVAG